MKTILDKINKADEIQAKKVELGKHEVELALIDDFKKLKSETILAQDEALVSFNDLKSILIKTDNFIKKYLQLSIQLSNVKDELNSKYKELGLNFETSKEYADFKKAFEKQKELIDYQLKIKNLK
jgi:hypothetical protein